MTYGPASRRTSGDFRLDSKGLATTAGATSLALVAYLLLNHQTLPEAGAVGSSATPTDPRGTVERLRQASLEGRTAQSSSGQRSAALLASVGAIASRPMAGQTHALLQIDTESSLAPRDTSLAPIAPERFVRQPRPPELSSGTLVDTPTDPQTEGSPREERFGNPRLLADRGPVLAPDGNSLARLSEPGSRLEVDNQAFRDGLPEIALSPKAPDKVPVQLEPALEGIPYIEEEAEKKLGTAERAETRDGMIGHAETSYSLTGSVQARPSNIPVDANLPDAEPNTRSSELQVTNSPSASVSGSRIAGRVSTPRRPEVSAVASHSADETDPAPGRRQLAALAHRLEVRSLARSRTKDARMDSDAATRARIVDHAGQQLGGGISVQVRDGDLVAVRLGELISLFEHRLDRPLFVWLKTSAAADKFVTPGTLARAGIRMTYDPVSGQAMLSIAD